MKFDVTRFAKKLLFSAIEEAFTMITFHRKVIEASFSTHCVQNLIKKTPTPNLIDFYTLKWVKIHKMLPLPLDFWTCEKNPGIYEK